MTLIYPHIILITISLYSSDLLAQKADPIPSFITPMDIKMDLSGNFMEPRSDHFHSGLDIRTQGKEGIPVRAVADGWVSRIKISPWGYGHAVYIDHPNGYTSVYGHLQRLKGPVADACLDQQYRLREFSIDHYPEKGAIPVKQGEVFALSGNSGSSSGPHLHYELRRSSDQHALDPETLGIELVDGTPPEIHGVRIYPLTDSSRVASYPANARGFAVQGAAGRYGLKPGNDPSAYGTVGLALHTIDRYDANSARFGVRSIALLVDSIPVFSTRFAELDFDLNRYSNAHMDYAMYKGAKMEYHRCYKLPNNKLRIYGKGATQGRIALIPGRKHHVHFIVTDANGNRSELTFWLRGATAQESSNWPDEEIQGSLFRYDSENVLNEESVRMTLPALALYDDTYIRYTRKPTPPRGWSPIHVIHDPLTPIHTNCSLTIEVPELPDLHGDKALIVKLDDSGKPTSVGGKWTKGSITGQVRSFGSYCVMVDSIPPKISNVDLRSEMKGRTSFTVRISDDLSGVGNWTGRMNGKWVLMVYDPKTNALTHTFDKHTSAVGKSEFTLEVRDDRGNLALWSMTFTR